MNTEASLAESIPQEPAPIAQEPRLRVDLAHEFANELHLTPPPFVGAGVSHFDNGIGQAFREFERAQHWGW